MKRTANRRQLKNYLIVNKFHFKLLIISLIYGLLIFAVIIGEVLFPFYRNIFQVSDLYAQHYSAKFFIVLLNRLSIALLVILLFTLLYQVMINHKFCGPLVNFSNTFKKISQGDFTRKIFLRRYDFLKNEAAQVNDMIDSLSEHIMALKRDYGLLLSALEDMSKAETDQDEYQNILETLKKQADICDQHLSKFKIDDARDRENRHRSDV
jgi:methyl-accepting chemotaxis protein